MNRYRINAHAKKPLGSESKVVYGDTDNHDTVFPVHVEGTQICT